MNRDARIDRLLEPYSRVGGRTYGENVTQLDHMLQTASNAAQDGASSELVLAALLHDYGHFLHDLGEDAVDRDIDVGHESLGARFLADYFGPEVVLPIALHVEAKRYLCRVDPDYKGRLSQASVASLEVQGGPMSAAQAEQFRERPFADSAVRLRRYDDLGKRDTASAPGLDSYRDLLGALLLRSEPDPAESKASQPSRDPL